MPGPPANKIIAQYGYGVTSCPACGDVYDYDAAADNNDIESMQPRILTWQTMMTGTLGSDSKAVNSLYLFDWFGQPRTTAGLSGTTAYKTSWISDSTDGTCTSLGMGMIKVLCFYSGAGGWVPIGDGSSPTFNSPGLGNATAQQLLATGIVDGAAPVTLTTGTTYTLGGTYNSGYTFNQETMAMQAVTYTLPSGTSGGEGKQYCIANSYNASTSTQDQGALTLHAAIGQYIIYNSKRSVLGGNVQSNGALGDSICVVKIDSLTWQVVGQPVGTWTLH
ncbi:MAG: hypothetical protein WAM71_19645 [Candidatus Korobacteraceae bacterium]